MKNLERKENWKGNNLLPRGACLCYLLKIKEIKKRFGKKELVWVGLTCLGFTSIICSCFLFKWIFSFIFFVNCSSLFFFLGNVGKDLLAKCSSCFGC